MSEIHNVVEGLSRFLTPIEEIREDPDNPRTHDRRNLDSIRESLVEFGQDQLLVAEEETKIVRKGNGRLRAARELGWTHVGVIFLPDSTIRGIARGIADNRTSDLSSFDDRALAAQLLLLEDEFAPGTSPTGFSDGEVRELLAGLEGGDTDSGSPVATAARKDPTKAAPSGPDPESRIVLIVPEDRREQVLEWIAADGPHDPRSLGEAVIHSIDGLE